MLGFRYTAFAGIFAVGSSQAVGCEASSNAVSNKEAPASASTTSLEAVPNAESAAGKESAGARFSRPPSSRIPEMPYLDGSAQALGGGVRFKILRRGSGRKPSSGDLIAFDRVIYDSSDGSLLGNTLPRRTTTRAPLDSLPAEYQKAMSSVPTGSDLAVSYPAGGARPLGGVAQRPLTLFFKIHAYEKDAPKSSGDSLASKTKRSVSLEPPKAATRFGKLAAISLTNGTGQVVKGSDVVTVLATVWIENRNGDPNRIAKDRRMVLSLSQVDPDIRGVLDGRKEGDLIQLWGDLSVIGDWVDSKAQGPMTVELELVRLAARP